MQIRSILSRVWEVLIKDIPFEINVKEHSLPDNKAIIRGRNRWMNTFAKFVIIML